jgi:hypothetical protein
VCDETYSDLGCLATALVVYQDGDEHLGPGFFRMAASPGIGALCAEDAPPPGEPWDAMTEAQRVFWSSHVHAMYERFAK